MGSVFIPADQPLDFMRQTVGSRWSSRDRLEACPTSANGISHRSSVASFRLRLATSPFVFISTFVWLLAASLFTASATEAVPDKLIVLTFDDSVASHYTVARPLLKRYGFGASFFITEGFNFRTNKKDYMTWDQIAELHRDGFDIGNHTRDHLSITAKTVSRLADQLKTIDSRCRDHKIPKPTTFA